MRFNKTEKATLHNFDFSEFAEEKPEKTTLADFRKKAGWLLPQLVSFFGTSLKLRKDETTGLYSPTYFIRDNLQLCTEEKILYEGAPVPVEILKGMIRILVHYPRGDILNATSQKQTKEGIRYAANVPLILSAFKEFRNVKYSEWDWQDENMKFLLDEAQADLIPYIVDPKLQESLQQWTSGDLLHIREEANTRDVPLTSLYSIAVTQDMEFKRLPRLLKLMLCQVWIYHPSVRHNLGICSVQDVDTFPDPLNSSDVPVDKDSPWFTEKPTKPVHWGTKRVQVQTNEIPWDV